MANFLSDFSDTMQHESYKETHVVRILEFETPNLNVNNRTEQADIEMWDVGGNLSFSALFPTLRYKADAIIFVFNPNKEEHSRELETYYVEFVEKGGFSDSQCVVFAFSKDKYQGKSVRLCKQHMYIHT